jgi:hypothetical protein
LTAKVFVTAQCTLPMYRGLFNPRVGLSPEDFREVGNLTAALVLRWNHWVHRRVERSEFADEDVISRRASIDFTLPYWFHERRDTPARGVKRQLIPLGLLRKGTLVNFSLADESRRTLPLLNTAQNRQVAEATLVAIAEQTLDAPVAQAVRCDIRHVVDGDPPHAAQNLATLYERRDAAENQRRQLRGSDLFVRVAEPLASQFLGLTMVDIGWHQRRVIHLSYDESLWINRRVSARRRFDVATIGEPRRIVLMVPSVGDADSYHFEVEAPDGLQISARAGFTSYPTEGLTPLALRAGSYQRAHVHFPQAEQGAEAAVIVELLPRPSAIVRAGFFAALLTTGTLIFLRLRLDAINLESHTLGPAAALLLAFPGLVSLHLARSGENAMTTNLLWPLRVLALLPGIAGFIGAAAIVGGSSGRGTGWVLWGMVAIAGLSALFLGQTWFRLWQALRR